MDAARRTFLLLGVVTALGAALLAACLEIDGGAVEVAWVLRSYDEKALRCREAEPPIARIRLVVTPFGSPDEDLCAAGTLVQCAFECEGGVGTSAFDIPPGDYLFSLQAETEDGSPLGPGEVVVPAPLLRSIVRGEITDLGVWQVVAQRNP
jgi:hypothetical protein